VQKPTGSKESVVQQLELERVLSQRRSAAPEKPVVELEAEVIAAAVAVMTQAIVVVLRPRTEKEVDDDR
jgi:hypothetical protein